MIKLNKKQKSKLKNYRNFEDLQVNDFKKNPELMLSYLNNALEDYKVHKNIAILNNALQIIARAIGIKSWIKSAQ